MNETCESPVKAITPSREVCKHDEEVQSGGNKWVAAATNTDHGTTGRSASRARWEAIKATRLDPDTTSVSKMTIDPTRHPTAKIG
jgi:hypothetical protein